MLIAVLPEHGAKGDMLAVLLACMTCCQGSKNRTATKSDLEIQI